MKRNTKIFCAALALVLVFGAVVGGTLAWLTDNTESVVNTFTAGNVDITLTETDADSDGSSLLNSYKMVPGNKISKDPKVTVLNGSEACWLFVKIDESENLDTYINYSVADGWIALDIDSNAVTDDGVYYRKQDAVNNEDGVKYSVLADDEVTVNTDVTKGDMDGLSEGSEPTLTFTAFAIQQANVGADVNADEATNALAAWNKVSSEG